jgi:hypothetical protein
MTKSLDGVICKRIVTGTASKVSMTAFKFKSNDIELAMVMYTTALLIQFDPPHFCALNDSFIHFQILDLLRNLSSARGLLFLYFR